MTHSYNYLKSFFTFMNPSFYRLTVLLFLLSYSFIRIQAQGYTVDTDRANANYRVGETVVFKVTSTVNVTVEYEIILDKHTAAVTTGTVALQAGSITEIPFTTNEPSVVHCRVKTEGALQVAAAAISPFDLHPIEEEPARFDAFWEEARTELASIPIDPKLVFYSESEYSTTYRINIATIDGRRVYGYISIPKMEGPYPGVITLPAYGSIASVVRPTIYLAEQAGVLSMAISIHNVEPDIVDPKAYKPNNIMNEYTNYYRYAVLACIRSIDYMFSRADFTGELAVTGVSQGGGLSLMTAGLDERVDLLVYSNASHCEHAGKKYEKASGFPYYLNQARLMYNIDADDEEQIVQACKYYDASYFARRYKGPSLGFISYLDDVSPPTTTFAAANEVQGMKVLMHGKLLKHEHPQEYWVGRYDALRRFLPNSIRAPWPYARKTKGYLLDIGEDQVITQGERIDFSPTLIQHEDVITLPAEWIQAEGPEQVIFSNPTSLNTSVTFNTPGTYKLQVRVLDEALLADKSKFYTITDDITIVVHDGNAPLLIECPESITSFSAINSATASWELPTILSACGVGEVTIEQTKGFENGSAFPIGRTPVEYTITDACGNTTTCTFYVTILKETFTPLVVNCPNDVVINTDNTSAIGNWNPPNIVSACNTNPTTYSQTEGLPLGSTFPLGETRISYQITDACGQEASCSFTITVIQIFEPLEIECPADINITTDEASILVNWELPEVLSACNSIAVEYTEAQGFEPNTAFPLGETRISYQITDACGQETTCSFTINVIQTFEPLEVECPADINIDTEYENEAVNWELPEILSACNTEVVEYIEAQSFEPNDLFPVGETTVDYRIIDACGQETTCSFMITVNQVFEPIEIACPTDIMLSTDSTTAIASWELPEVLSACRDESVQYMQTEGLDQNTPFPLGETIIKYLLTDACGQQSTCSFKVIVMQNILPLVISCPSDTTVFTYTDNALPNWALPEVISACMDNGIQYIQRAGPTLGNAFPLGDTPVSYEVTDACGQQETCAFVISVEQIDRPPLQVRCPDDITLFTTNGGAEPRWGLPEILSSCGENGVQYVQTEGSILGSIFRVGETRISYEIMDACEQVTSCSFMVFVIDNSPPLLNISCPFNQTFYTYAQDTTVTWELPGIISACDETGVEYTQVAGLPSGSTFPLGSMRITYKVEDACEQTKFCSFIITVIQHEGETLAVECPEDVKMILPLGRTHSTVNWNIPLASSTCTGDIIISQIQGPPSGSLLPEGTSTVSYIIQDPCESRYICTFKIEVAPPEIKDLDIDSYANQNNNDRPITAFPNPVKDRLTIAWQSEKEEVLTIELINPLGQVLYQKQLEATKGKNSTELPMQHLSSGWYVWRLKSTATWGITRQVLKQ